MWNIRAECYEGVDPSLKTSPCLKKNLAPGRSIGGRAPSGNDDGQRRERV